MDTARNSPGLGVVATLGLGVALLGLWPIAEAGSPTAPTDGTTEGETAGSFPTGTVQCLYFSSELKGLRNGDLITGISFRLNETATAFAGASFTKFEIVMGEGGTGLDTTFADNFTDTPVSVRTGSLAFAAVDFEDEKSPNAFGKIIEFDTPFAYTGGNLVIEFRTSTSDNLPVDGFNTGISGKSISNLGSSTATTANVPVSTFNYAVAFQVATAGLPPVEIDLPNGAAGEGSDSFNVKFGVGSTVQNLYREADLNGLKAGDQIVGFCLRLDGVHNLFTSTTFSRFDVKIGPAAASFTGTYAERFGPNPAVVRTGPMTLFLPARTADPNLFGGLIRFDSPYVYTGGDLLVETRFTSPVTPDFISLNLDQLTAGDGATGSQAFTSNPDSLSPQFTESVNWPLQLKVIPAPPPAVDNIAPTVSFAGRGRLKPGKRPTRVRGSVSDNEEVKTIQFRASTGDKKTLNASRMTVPFAFKFKNRKRKPRVRVKIIAIDASGNRRIGKRVYR